MLKIISCFIVKACVEGESVGGRGDIRGNNGRHVLVAGVGLFHVHSQDAPLNFGLHPHNFFYRSMSSKGNRTNYSFREIAISELILLKCVVLPTGD